KLSARSGGVLELRRGSGRAGGIGPLDRDDRWRAGAGAGSVGPPVGRPANPADSKSAETVCRGFGVVANGARCGARSRTAAARNPEQRNSAALRDPRSFTAAFGDARLFFAVGGRKSSHEIARVDRYRSETVAQSGGTDSRDLAGIFGGADGAGCHGARSGECTRRGEVCAADRRRLF